MRLWVYKIFIAAIFAFLSTIAMDKLEIAKKDQNFDVTQQNYLENLPVDLGNKIVENVFRNSFKDFGVELFDAHAIWHLAKASTRCFYAVKTFLDQFKNIQYRIDYM